MRSIIAVVFCALAACGGKSEPAGDKGGDKGGEPGAAAPRFDQARAQAVVDNIKLEGWQTGMAKPDSDGLLVTMASPENNNGGKVNLIIAGINCMGGICAELNKAAWEAQADNLKGKLSAELRANPDLVWEVSEIEVEGKKAIAVYSLSYVEKPGENGPARYSTHGYDVYWHNGSMFFNVTATASAFPKSLDELKTKVTKEELEAAAKKGLGLALAKI